MAKGLGFVFFFSGGFSGGSHLQGNYNVFARVCAATCVSPGDV